MAWSFREAFRRAVREVKHFFPEYMLIGRNARNFYATPISTIDIDFLVDLDDLVRLAKAIDVLDLYPKDVGHWQYSFIVNGVKVDLVKPKGFKLDKEILTRRRLVKIKKVGNVYIPSPEDLTLLYIISSEDRGTRDLENAYEIIYFSKARDDFNEEYFLRKCRENSVEALCYHVLNNVE